MSEARRMSESLPQRFQSYDARVRENITRTGLGIRTSADVFESMQRDLEEAREARSRRISEDLPQRFQFYDARVRENIARAGLGIRTSADVFEAIQRASEEAREARRGRARSCERERLRV